MEQADKYETEQMQAMAYSLQVGARSAVMESYRLLCLANEWDAAKLLLEDMETIIAATLVPFKTWVAIEKARGVKL